MQVTVNGKSREVSKGTSVADYLEGLNLVPESVVIELNKSILPRTDWTRILGEGDRLEVISFVGGG